jgi:hypothetical protein
MNADRCSFGTFVRTRWQSSTARSELITLWLVSWIIARSESEAKAKTNSEYSEMAIGAVRDRRGSAGVSR